MARSFNGSSDFVAADAAHVFSMSGAFSLAFWLKAANPGANKICYGEGNSVSSNPFIQAGANASAKAVVFVRGDTGATQTLTATTATVADSTWHHVCYTQDASGNYKFYVDGVADATGSYTSGTTTLDRTTIGGFRATGGISTPITGSLQHVATWTRQITAGEAASLGMGALPSHFAPAHYWPLWGADSPEPDLGGATHTAGTLTGTAFVAGPRVGISLFGLKTPFDYLIPTATVTGSVAVASTVTVTTAGVATHYGSAAVAETVTVATAGTAVHFGSSAVTETVTVSVSGGETEHGSVSLTETVTVTVRGSAPAPPLEIVYSRVYGIELTLTDDGVEQVSRLVTSLDGF